MAHRFSSLLLRESCCEMKSQSRKLKGRRNIDFLGKSKIAIRPDELVKVGKTEEDLKLLQRP